MDRGRGERGRGEGRETRGLDPTVRLRTVNDGQPMIDIMGADLVIF